MSSLFVEIAKGSVTEVVVVVGICSIFGSAELFPQYVTAGLNCIKEIDC
jgi:hypothetical protein